MKKKISVMPVTQLPKMQLFFFVFFFFTGVLSFSQIHVSTDTKFYVSSGTTIVDNEISTVTEKVVIYVAEGTVAYNLDKIENSKIIQLKTSEKIAEKVEKLPKDIIDQPSVKNIESQYHFNTNPDSDVIKKSKHSISTIFLPHHEIKADHLPQNPFQPNQTFFFNLGIGVVLLLFFNLIFQALTTRPPPYTLILFSEFQKFKFIILY